MHNSGRRYSSRRPSQHIQPSPIDDNLEDEEEVVLPPNGRMRAVITGVVGGIITLIVHIRIVYANASLLNQGTHPGESVSSQATNIASLLGFWSFPIHLLIAFFLGMLVGWIAVKRNLGTLAGRLFGGIIGVGLFLAPYLPGYPGVITTTIVINEWFFAGLAVALVRLLLYIAAGGFMSWMGACLATRKHPYYRSR